jgi:predicted phage terminase large subunit-like protein
MQTPTDDEGSFFRREWFKRFELNDYPHTNNYQSTDFATKEDGGDYTELGVFGMDGNGEMWIKDWWYKQSTTDVWIDAQLDQYQKHNCFAAFGETGPIRRSIEPFQAMRSRARGIYPRLEWLVRTGDKAAMARSFQGMAASGMIHIPKTDWGERLIDQLCKFPNAKHDDAVDVCALMAMAVQSAHPAIIHATTKQDKPKDLWGRKQGGSSWRTA